MRFANNNFSCVHVVLLCLASQLCGCPLALQSRDNLRFACQSDQDCIAGYNCSSGFCTVIDAGAHLADARITDATYDDTNAPDRRSADAYQTEVFGQDLVQTDNTRSDQAQTDNPQRDTTVDDITTSDQGNNDNLHMDLLQPDVATPDVNGPDSNGPDAFIDDTFIPDSNLPDTFIDDTFIPDSNLPDTIASDWWDADWSTRHQVFIHDAGSETLIDFPLLVVFDGSIVDYSDTCDDGRDLRFIDPNTRLELDYEIDTWNEAGKSYVWVRIPSISAVASQHFVWLYVGNENADDRQNPAGVWRNGYRSVWHMNVDQSVDPLQTRDSSPNAKHGTLYNINDSQLVTTELGAGLDFDGNDIVGINESWRVGDALDVVGGPASFVARVYPRQDTGTIVAKRVSNDIQWQFYIDSPYSDDQMRVFFHWTADDGTAHRWRTTNDYAINRWYTLGVSVGDDGRPLAFYVDGDAAPMQAEADSGGTATHHDINASIAARWTYNPPGDGVGFPFRGIIDEVRIAATVRSDAWMRAQFHSMQGNMTALGAAERR